MQIGWRGKPKGIVREYSRRLRPAARLPCVLTILKRCLLCRNTCSCPPEDQSPSASLCGSRQCGKQWDKGEEKKSSWQYRSPYMTLPGVCDNHGLG